jgi:hypothetical protein
VAAVADSAAVVAGAAIGGAVAVVAADAEIAGNSSRVSQTRAAGPTGMPRFFVCAQERMLRWATSACASKSNQAPARLGVGAQGVLSLGCNLRLTSEKASYFNRSCARSTDPAKRVLTRTAAFGIFFRRAKGQTI